MKNTNILSQLVINMLWDGIIEQEIKDCVNRAVLDFYRRKADVQLIKMKIKEALDV